MRGKRIKEEKRKDIAAKVGPECDKVGMLMRKYKIEPKKKAERSAIKFFEDLRSSNSAKIHQYHVILIKNISSLSISVPANSGLQRFPLNS